MELLLILTYAAICVAIFTIFRIPANKVDALDRRAGWHIPHRHHRLGHELQSSLYRQRAHLFYNDADHTRR